MRNYQGTKRPVVPVIVRVVPVDVRKTTVVGITTIETVRSALENLSTLLYKHCPLITLGTVFYSGTVNFKKLTLPLRADKEFLFFHDLYFAAVTTKII